MEAIPNATALVTGATGFIGCHLTERLIALGWQVKVLARNPAKLSAPAREAVEVIEGDLADSAALARAVAGVAVVFHCAANVATWDKTESYYAVNVTGVRNLLEAITKHNPDISRLVHVSTVDVYGYPLAPCDETAPLARTGFGYGDSKAQGETLVRGFCVNHAIPYAVLRPCNVIGPGSQFIERIGKELQSGLMLTIDKGRANAGMVTIDTLVDAILWAAQDERALGQCYNVRDGYDVSWGEFLRAFRQAIQGKGKVLNMPYAAAQVAAVLCEGFYRVVLPGKEPLLHRLLVRIFGRTCGHSAAKLQAASGIGRAVSFDEAMQASAGWYLNRNQA